MDRMKKKKLFQSVSLGLMVLFSVVLVACGRDVSTVEDALEGHWTVEDARIPTTVSASCGLWL